jgi:glutamyl-tRNA(Gln) amidotransferase subunit E
MEKIESYENLGFKAGLEIHQQLDTGKLFCNCPSVLRSDEPLSEVSRRLHLVAGESGEVDVAAAYQSLENKEFIYQTYDTTCLVELDEEPPHEINGEALKVATQISLLLNCKMVPISQMMRKTVVNGSNTSGFQRTVMIARDGYVETSEGRVSIDSVFLEEDSARPVEKGEGYVKYRLDRLGIPLVEITTGPDLKSAAHAKETAMMIGDILRSCKVRRGIGTIRQDINISIEGSNRVEIKGFQDPKIMEKTVDLEIDRQQLYLKLSKELPKFKSDKLIDVTGIFMPKLEWMKDAINSGAKFIATRLSGFSGFLGNLEGYSARLGKEIAGLARTRGFNGVIHGDEDFSKYQFEDDEVKTLKGRLGIGAHDSFIVILGNKEKIEKMVKELIFPFLNKLSRGNPEEVRNCLADGTTEFLRPMPGAARMYPETDCELLRLSRDYINDVKRDLPELRSVIEAKMRKEGLTEDMLTILFKENKIEDFKDVNSVIKNSRLVGKAMLLLPKELSSKLGISLHEVEDKLHSDVLIFVLEKIHSGNLDEGDLREVLERIVIGKDFSEAVKIEKVDVSSIEEFVYKIVKERPGLRPNAYMGLVMKEFGGKLSPKDAMRIINSVLG